MSLPKVRRLCALLFAVVLAFSFQLVAYAAHNPGKRNLQTEHQRGFYRGRN